MNFTTASYLLLALAIVSEILGTSALKASDGMTRLVPALIVVGGYALAFYLLALTLKTLPVGFVYAIWAGLGVVGVAIVGVLVFGEQMTVAKAAGMALIVGGVALVHLGTA
ncbi:MAG: multidrug efflux SMR transporter [Halofilum sp. (in: g-proteobacteria)]